MGPTHLIVVDPLTGRPFGVHDPLSVILFTFIV